MYQCVEMTKQTRVPTQDDCYWMLITDSLVLFSVYAIDLLIQIGSHQVVIQSIVLHHRSIYRRCLLKSVKVDVNFFILLSKSTVMQSRAIIGLKYRSDKSENLS